MSKPRVMLSRNEVDEMLELWDAGWTVDELAEKFGCSRATVSVALGDLLDEDVTGDEDAECLDDDEDLEEDAEECDEDLEDEPEEDGDEDDAELDEEDR